MAVLSAEEIAERKRVMLAWAASLPANTRYEGERVDLVIQAVNNLMRDIADLFDTVHALSERYTGRVDELLAANSKLVEVTRDLAPRVPRLEAEQ